MAKTLQIKSLTFDPRVPIGLEIIPIDDHYVRNSKNLVTPHRASFYCILSFVEGSPVHIIDFNPVQIEPGSFLFVGKDRVQFFDQVRPFKAKALLFTDEFFGKDRTAIRFLNRTPLFNSADGPHECIIKTSLSLEAYWDHIVHEEKAPPDHYKPLLLKNHLENFLLQAEREGAQNLNTGTRADGQQEVFYRLRDMVEENFRDQKPVAFYTENLRISGKVLTRITQKMAGKTPKQMLDERLLLEAKRLLIHDSDAGKTIGYSLGFNEPTNFIKFFRKHTGTTPATFREQYRTSAGSDSPGK